MESTQKPLKVLIVDDTVIYRKIVSDVLSELPDVQVVGTAHNGKAALLKIKTLQPDLLTLDIEMPEMNGLQVLQQLHQEAPNVGAIMLSTLTHEGGLMTIRALELGAFDFIPKPSSGTLTENRIAVKNALEPILKAYARSIEIKGMLGRSALSSRRSTKPTVSRLPVQRQVIPVSRSRQDASIIAIGISTGGPLALAKMLPQLPADIGVPIVIVQHMPPLFTQSLAKSLNNKCGLEVKEAEDGDSIQPNHVYIAPGGKQMKIAAGPDGKRRVIRITDDPPENNCKPSADYLFRSVADHFVGRATGVIMTGMGADGNKGLKQMKQNGAFIIAQDEASCVVFGMPREPIESGTADAVAPLDSMASQILKTVSYSSKRLNAQSL